MTQSSPEEPTEKFARIKSQQRGSIEFSFWLVVALVATVFFLCIAAFESWFWISVVTLVAAVVALVGYGVRNGVYSNYDDLFDEYEKEIRSRKKKEDLLMEEKRKLSRMTNEVDGFAAFVGAQTGEISYEYDGSYEALHSVLEQCRSRMKKVSGLSREIKKRDNIIARLEEDISSQKADFEQRIQESTDSSRGLLAEAGDRERELGDEVKSLKKQLNSSRKQIGEREKWAFAEIKQAKIDLQQAASGVLSNIKIGNVVRDLTSRFESGEAVSANHDDIAALYAVMHSKIPDMERVKELSLIPNELLRAQQKQAVIDHYSSLITKAEKNDELSEQEREDIINSYRLAREQELSGEE